MSNSFGMLAGWAFKAAETGCDVLTQANILAGLPALFVQQLFIKGYLNKTAAAFLVWCILDLRLKRSVLQWIITDMFFV